MSLYMITESPGCTPETNTAQYCQSTLIFKKHSVKKIYNRSSGKTQNR